ncbi:hypothetical protein PV326_011621 [Microctonus aethiopoides]|nr:hypothetical protein PV326_011621 [Microctonus aethiopoides]
MSAKCYSCGVKNQLWISVLALNIIFIFRDNCDAVSVINANANNNSSESEEKIETTTINNILSSEIKHHPCQRQCSDENGRGVKSMACYYSFKVESYYSMSKACYNCPLNISDCFRLDCVPTDGRGRSIQVVNRQLPGPTIEVCQGDNVIVDVMNSMIAETTSMHWHGQHNHATPYMDGVPFVTQCPIMPGATFRYNYIAATAGTHFWHSHSGFQRGDGVFGALIVKTSNEADPHYNLYDFDEHIMTINDWDHEIGMEKFLSHHHSNGDNKARNILVNGLGRYQEIDLNDDEINYKNGSDNEIINKMPLTIFSVNRGFRYRFRLINAGFLNCPIEISIDNHTMQVISTDGNSIEPVNVKYLVTYAGERFDFVVEMNQEIDNYWIRFRGLMDCDERFFSVYQVAVLRYFGANIDEDPKGIVTYDRPYFEDTNAIEKVMNDLNKGTESINDTISVPLLKSMEIDGIANMVEPDYKFYISYDFYAKDNPNFHLKNHYGFHQVNEKNSKLYTPQLNHITMHLPPFSLLSQRELINDDNFCNETTVHGCKDKFCSCTHVLQVKLRSVVEIILVDEALILIYDALYKGVTFDANHPFHLHGYDFRVIAMEKIDKNITVEKVMELDRLGLIKRNLKRAPVKDTVTVPDGGYTIIRFYADNPGYWLFHCHIEFHVEVGMGLVFKIGEHDEFPKVPMGFPRCGDWKPPVDDIDDDGKWNDVNSWVWHTKLNDSNGNLEGSLIEEIEFGVIEVTRNCAGF